VILFVWREAEGQKAGLDFGRLGWHSLGGLGREGGGHLAASLPFRASEVSSGGPALWWEERLELVVAITGASGVAIGARLLQMLAAQEGHQVHLLVSRAGEAVIAHELGEEAALPATWRWSVEEMTAPIASSSRAPAAMVVAPCSMKTLSAIAQGYASDLIGRTAEVMLRLNRPLVLMPRETPLSLPAIENMRLARLAGAILLPPIVAYYPRPRSVDEITDFFVGKVLDVLGLEHELYRRWGEETWT
jgi:4-hydroxy-3-polyprenylbenzoate decarboxylase